MPLYYWRVIAFPSLSEPDRTSESIYQSDFFYHDFIEAVTDLIFIRIKQNLPGYKYAKIFEILTENYEQSFTIMQWLN